MTRSQRLHGSIRLQDSTSAKGALHRTLTGITLELRGGRSLRMSEAVSVDRLAELIIALEAAEDRS